MAQRRRHAAAVFVLVLLTLFAAAGGLRAHGTGTPRVMNQPAGPYLLSAWTDPNPLRVDETHVVVGVTDPDTRAPVVSDVVVTVRMTSLDDPSQIREEVAGTDNVNRLLFAAEFDGQLAEGEWNVDLRVDGVLGVGEDVSFPVEIRSARTINWMWVGGGGLALIVLAWLGSSLRGDKPARQPRQKRRRRPPAG